MPLCERCVLIRIDDIRNQDFYFHPNLLSVKSSAELGCEFCSLCWRVLQVHNLQDDDGTRLSRLLRNESVWAEGEEWTPTIWLHGYNLHPHNPSQAWISVSCGIEYLGATYFDGKRQPYSNPTRPAVYGTLAIYDHPGKPSKYHFSGRRSTADRNPELYIALIKQWWRNCDMHHRQCDAGANETMPTRVIDVGDPSAGLGVRLLSTQGMRKSYIALSYCWGVDASEIPTLNKNTYAAMLKGIKESELAKTHQEFINLARVLGIQYVWVDALCIIQGDVADWEHESKTMAQVYRNATLTVIAGRSADSRQGFVTNNLHLEPGRPPPWDLPVDDSPDSGTAVIDLPRGMDIGPITSRAWCFQERLTCRRAVVFAKQQLFFQCMTEERWEDGKKGPGERPAFLRQPATPSPSGTTTPSQHRDELVQQRRDEALREWYALLRPYSSCRLSNPHDIFAAIMAIAQPASRVIGSRYLAGLWESDLVRGLLWRPCYHLEAGPWGKTHVMRPRVTRLTGESKSTFVVRAPSWSWAAVEGPVAGEFNTPPNIAKHKSQEYYKVRPIVQNPDRWSLDTGCDVDQLHMPACELRLMGHVTKAQLLSERVKDYFDANVTLHKRKYKYGIPLAMSGVNQEMKNSNPWSQVVAIAFFDVQDERRGVDYVWCLLLVEERGLILEKTADGKFSRLGWFKTWGGGDWITGQDKIEVRLC